MLTPSPNTSPLSSTTTSPRLMPSRNCIRRDSGSSALRVRMRSCTSIAASSADVADGNSTSMPSPVVFTMRPPWLRITGSVALRCARRADRVLSSSSAIIRENPATSATTIAASRRASSPTANTVTRRDGASRSGRDAARVACRLDGPLLLVHRLGRRGAHRRRAPGCSSNTRGCRRQRCLGSATLPHLGERARPRGPEAFDCSASVRVQR